MSEQNLPVLVVGAGPTGLMMACELVRHGVAVRVVDRAPAPATTSRALVVQPRTLEIYDDIGVLDSMHAAGRAVSVFNLFFDPEHRYRLDFDGLAADAATYSAHPSLYAISQHETERVLTEHLRALGVEIERGWALTDLVVDDAGVTATLHGSDGTSEEVVADLATRLPGWSLAPAG
jgi:2-polyprenyl-6-methoxyphenol hydroxylase-like FAD-dependent oxidoreductase